MVDGEFALTRQDKRHDADHREELKRAERQRDARNQPVSRSSYREHRNNKGRRGSGEYHARTEPGERMTSAERHRQPDTDQRHRTEN